MNRIETAAVIYMEALEKAVEVMGKTKTEALTLYIATVTIQAIDGLVNVECPNCHTLLDTPSLEDIQGWLQEEHNANTTS